MLRQSLSFVKNATQRLYTHEDLDDSSLDLSITEPAVFVPTFTDKPAVLRGTCQLRVKDTLTIKRVSVNFRGTSRVTWPHGLRDIQTVTDSTLTLFSPGTSEPPCYSESLADGPQHPWVGKRCRLWHAVTSRLCADGGHEKGAVPRYQRLAAGIHTYNFEMVLHSHLPESIQIRQSQVRYRVRACVECPGILKRSFACNIPIATVHCPAEDEVDDAEPVYIARAWKNLVQCEILVSRRGAPLGDELPVTVMFTELATANFRGLRVFLSENVQYLQKDGLVGCSGPFRRALLYEKVDGPVPTLALRRASNDERPESGKGDCAVAKMVGDSEMPSEPVRAGETSLDVTLQLPTCHLHSQPDGIGTQGMHFDTRYKNVRVRHWLEFVFLMSPHDGLGSTHDRIVQKVAKVPLALRSCYAQHANASLPAYS
ncbi:arrestin domain-containing protein [Aspergillus ellipticus CBS 707.79]|uniref:Arrestin domain-containing protein n=1 Tax=Aspergillus ellipticus CBS 707.79 TaxID=1448320 RepID=A0A319CR79_9EURO|nr:arrestin domain-containing protein [Aspergillus ellipticus CBS 707.79]